MAESNSDVSDNEVVADDGDESEMRILDVDTEDLGINSENPN